MIDIESSEVKDRIIITLVDLLDNVVNKGNRLNEKQFTENGFVIWIDELQPLKRVRLVSQVDSTKMFLKIEEI